jgi:hypothetical protein
MLYELIALALQTDSTRIATLEIGGDFLPQNLGIGKGLSRPVSPRERRGGDRKHLIALETYQIQHFGKFVARLAKIEDGDRTLLDSTAVLFGSGMGMPTRTRTPISPIILAGGGYKHGEFKKVPS